MRIGKRDWIEGDLIKEGLVGKDRVIVERKNWTDGGGEGDGVPPHPITFFLILFTTNLTDVTLQSVLAKTPPNELKKKKTKVIPSAIPECQLPRSNASLRALGINKSR